MPYSDPLPELCSQASAGTKIVDIVSATIRLVIVLAAVARKLGQHARQERQGKVDLFLPLA